MCEVPATFVDEFHDLDEIKSLKYNRLGETDLWVTKLSFGCGYLAAGVTIDAATGEPISGHEHGVRTVQEAIKRGINYIDVAPLYAAGKSEIVLGYALKDIPRKAYYIATKVGRNHDCQFDYSAASILKTFEESLKRLRLTYVDVLHVHDVEFVDVDTLMNETLPTLDKLRNEGKVHYIAINGYPLNILKDTILNSKVKIDIVQTYCRCTLFDNSLVENIHFFKERKLGLINAASYGMGLLTKAKVPDWHPAKPETKKACEEATKLCNAHGVDISRIAINHAFETKGVDTTLVGLKDIDLLHENLDILKKGLKERETQMKEKVMKEIFDKLSVRHWEGVELEKFRENKDELEKFLKKMFA